MLVGKVQLLPTASNTFKGRARFKIVGVYTNRAYHGCACMFRNICNRILIVQLSLFFCVIVITRCCARVLRVKHEVVNITHFFQTSLQIARGL